jgi:SP family general alpha glucoside:H+ symporter-like MFS transporter
MCWGGGILLSSGVVRAVAGINGDMGWRLPFILQWVWPIPLIIGTYLAPESPWNSVRRSKEDEARTSLHRLYQDMPEREQHVEQTLAYIKYTTEMEKLETANASFLECFKGTNRRRTEIVSFFSSAANKSLATLMGASRTASSGQLKFSAEMRSLATRWSFFKLQVSANFRPLISTSRYRRVILSVA